MLRQFAIAVVVLAAAAPAWADDIVRLGGADADDADTHLVYRRGWGGGYRGWGGGFYGSRYGYGYHSWRPHYYGYHGHYRHWGGYGGYYRPYAYYPSYYHSYYRAPYYSYYRPYYAYPVHSYYSFAPCVGDELVMPEATALGSTNHSATVERAAPISPPRSNGAPSYFYDGGPRQAVPLPGVSPAPTKTPPAPTLPREGRLVSLPPAGQYAYPAYGETQPARPPSTDTRLVRSPTR
jgi:hypothetical protein